MSLPKVLVVGAIEGQLEKAFQKIAKIHSKQLFSFVIVVGDLFAVTKTLQSEKELTLLLNGSITVPLPTYFTLGSSSVPSLVQDKLEAEGEVCTNLFYLGRKGTLTTTEGIRIVNLGGRLVQNDASVTQAVGSYDPLYLESDASALAGAHSADILITNDWPLNITKHSSILVPKSIETIPSQQAIAQLNLALKPRYHFASSPLASWAREPYIQPQDMSRQIKSYEDLDGAAVQVTRFTSLASVDRSNKEWISAFTLDPSKPPSTEGAQPACPLVSATEPKRKRAPDDNANGYSRYQHGHHDRPHRQNKKSRQNEQDRFDKAACFMCAGTPAFRPEMVVSIADESMLTILKGPLPLRYSTFPTLHSSGHIMIIPMYHALDEAAHGQRSSDDLHTEFDEMSKYKAALQQSLGAKGLGAVCWEVNRTGIRHLHWQLIACPTEKITSGLVDAAYKVAAEKAQYPTFESCDPSTLIPGQRSDYFRVWIWRPANNPTDVPDADRAGLDSKLSLEQKAEAWSILSPTEKADRLANGETDPTSAPSDAAPQAGKPTQLPGSETSMFFAISPSMRFNISFGREVMAGLLQLDDRSDWRRCESTVAIEAADARAFKEDFAPWDWAMA